MLVLATTVLVVGPVGSPAGAVPVARSAPTPPSFTDVSAGHPFYGHITWLAEEGISTGYADGSFRPGAGISRAAMAAFLHRIAGGGGTPPSSPTFRDVGPGNPFYADVEWLAAEQIARGYQDGTFRPSAPSTRQAMAAYLYRFSDSPSFTPPDEPSFADVGDGNPFSLEVEWLAAEGIATGSPGDRFLPGSTVSRQAMAAFVFRQQHLAPTLTVQEPVLQGLRVPWDVAFTPSGEMLFTERPGSISIRFPDGEVVPLVAAADPGMSDLFLGYHESGLLGLALHPSFASNRRAYTCQTEVDGDGSGDADPGPNAQVVEWTLGPDLRSISRTRELVDLAPMIIYPPDRGYHGGCRVRFGQDELLWVSAGDAGCGWYSQDLTVLGGKILRLDLDQPNLVATENPYVGGDPRDDLVVSYGHRNPQGLAPRPGGYQMWSVEHGSYRDDEVNLVQAQGNYGWDPIGPPDGGCTYDETRPMTDLQAHPDAIRARWTSGDPTIATSGATWLQGSAWGGWEGGLVVATLKEQHVRVLFFTDSGVFVEERRPTELDHTFGRLRTPVVGPGGDLYVTTSNSASNAAPGQGVDQILRVTPTP
jgi:glucose/arabinose dehydrogenase